MNNKENKKKDDSQNKKSFLDILKEKFLPIAEEFLKTTLKDAAVSKFQETEEKVMTKVDSTITDYKNKIIFVFLMLIGVILTIYSFFEIFFKNIGYEEWTNFGAGIFFIFVAMIMYFINNFFKK